MNIISKTAIAILKIFAIIVVISGCVFTGRVIIENKEHIKNNVSANRLALTYDEVGEDENSTQSPYVKFDAYFLNSNGSSAKKVRGAVVELNERPELQIELNVLTNGRLENGRITIQNDNFTIVRDIATDNEIKQVVSSRNIYLNTIQSGTYKTIPVLLGQDVENKNELSSSNSVTFTAIHIAEDGTKTPIEKTVEFQLDWYGVKNLVGFSLYKQGFIVNKTDQVNIGLNVTMHSRI